MSEEINSLHDYYIKQLQKQDDEYGTLYEKYTNLQQKVEQLEEENKELNRMCELYGQSLYNADLTKAEKKVEQLENIIKEAIECIETDSIEINTKEYGNLTVINSDNLLNILNKGRG